MSNQKPPSQNAIGRALNLSSANMVKLKKQGCPMDSVASVQAWREARQNVAARKPSPVLAAPPKLGHGRVGGDDFHDMIRANKVETSGFEVGEDHQEARTRREIAEANLAEMREAEERGSLIRIDVVKTSLATVFSTLREALLQIPPRLAPLLAANNDPGSVQNALHAEIHQALMQLSGASDQLRAGKATT